MRQPDGKIGFEFEARAPKAGKDGAKGARATAGALRVLGNHPIDGQEISVFAGRYGPYVKHGKANATIADKDKAESITLEEAVELLDEKFGAPVKKAAKKVVKKVVKKAVDPEEVEEVVAKKSKTTKAVAAKKPVAKAPAVRRKKAA